ncbi:SfnB family sulfur acquisition oxidoreductase, partial [Burkholderia cenocepacia]|uniref:acyl-CoA dehydrogenase family protein n=1 Tax=Burkholderia cenocepacia TaxID=95486 RepID=UPI002234ED04
NGPLSQILQAAIDAGIANAAIDDTLAFVRTRTRPWVDSGVERAVDDPLTIREIGRLHIQLHAADALLERAARTLDEITAKGDVTEDDVARASVAVGEAKVLTTEVALLAGEKLFELAGTQSTLAEHNLDRHWRNARTHTLHDPVRWKYHLVGNYYLNGARPARHAWN